MTNDKNQKEDIRIREADSSEVLAGEFEFLTVNEIAKLLKVSQITIRRMVSSREVPYYRVRKKILFKRSDVEAYLRKQRTDNTEGI